MSKLNLGKWELEDDQTNNRLIARSVDTGEEYHFGENGSDQSQYQSTFELDSGGGSEVIYVGAMTADGQRTVNVKATIYGATDHGVSYRLQERSLWAGQFNNGNNFQHRWSGVADSGEETHFIVSKTTDNSSGATNDRFHLYIKAEDYAQGELELIHPQGFMDGFSMTYGLTETNIQGSVVYDTRTDGPDRMENMGDSTAKVMNGVVNATHNDFSSIQGAIRFADSNGHGTVFIPTGTYTLSEPICPGRGMVVTGAGADQTILKNSNEVFHTTADSNIGSTDRCTIEHMTLELTSGSSYIGQFDNNEYDPTLQYCRCLNGASSGDDDGVWINSSSPRVLFNRFESISGDWAIQNGDNGKFLGNHAAGGTYNGGTGNYFAHNS